MKKHLVVALTLLASASAVLATTVTPSYGTFGTLSDATFGGSGIPNNAVAYTTFNSGNDNLTIGLSATQRYFNPPLANNGAGTFTATAGENNGLASPPKTLGPTWNFDFYINAQILSQTPYSYKLIYGNNTTGNFSTFDLTAFLVGGKYQDSWNLDFSFLNTIGYDPNASGIYGFELDVVNDAGSVVAKTAINVDVEGGHVPDNGSTALLLGCGFAGLAIFQSRQIRRALAK